MDNLILRPPYIKGKNFCPNPVVKNGIPRYADSRLDKKVVGTPDWEKYWEEQLHYIHNGYQTGGLWIPGRYYYYLNFSVMADLKRGNINPDIDDLHLELAYLIDHCKLNGKNLMIPKARRKGISEATHKMVIDYGWRFTYTYKAGIASGKKDFIDDFVAKLRYGWMNLPPELYVNPLLNNDDEIIAGYQERNYHGSFVDAGTMNTVYTRTIHTDATGFKGNYYRDIIVEEIGETEKFLEFWRGTRDALTDGMGNQVGSAYFYGTGGNMEKGSKDFKKAWSRDEKNSFIETNNFLRFLIPAQRFYFYGGAGDQKRELPLESELYKKYKAYQLIGVEDIDLSLKDILRKREDLIKKSDKQDYFEYLQNNPINEQEIFAKTVVNDFNSEKLREQSTRIEQLTHPMWSKYKLEWVKDDKGQIKIPLAVVCKPLKAHEDQDECIWIIDSEHPRKSHSNLYVAGVDSYDQDKAKSSKSLGAMSIRIRHNHIPNAMKNAPVAIINCRPKRKETFYELVMKAAVYYGFDRMNVGNILGDVANALIMEHFKQWGLWHCLSDRPRKFESENSEQTHEKWVRLTNFSRPRRGALMQTWVEDGIQDCWFGELINQYGNFDIMEIGSDNDLADADGIALMQDVSCDIKARDEDGDEITDRYKLPEFTTDANGTLMPKGRYDGTGLLNPEQDGVLFKNILGLD